MMCDRPTITAFRSHIDQRTNEIMPRVISTPIIAVTDFFTAEICCVCTVDNLLWSRVQERDYETSDRGLSTCPHTSHQPLIWTKTNWSPSQCLRRRIVGRFTWSGGKVTSVKKKKCKKLGIGNWMHNTFGHDWFTSLGIEILSLELE